MIPMIVTIPDWGQNELIYPHKPLLKSICIAILKRLWFDVQQGAGWYRPSFKTKFIEIDFYFIQHYRSLYYQRLAGIHHSSQTYQFSSKIHQLFDFFFFIHSKNGSTQYTYYCVQRFMFKLYKSFNTVSYYTPLPSVCIHVTTKQCYNKINAKSHT